MISGCLGFAAIVARVKNRSLAGHSWVARGGIAATLLATLALGGCGSSISASRLATVRPQSSAVPSGCAATVLDTLTSVLGRVYSEGVHGERIGSAEYLISHSQTLRAAVESGNQTAARAAAHALLATGHLTDLIVIRDGRTFVEEGGAALAPLHGTLAGASGAPIASYVASVWADEGFLIEARGISQGIVALRAGRDSVGG